MNEQLSFDFGDEQPTQPRIPLSFVGTTSKSITLDPAEFRGMGVPAITEEIKSVLRGIAPDVDFFEDDLVEAAHAIAARD